MKSLPSSASIRDNTTRSHSHSLSSHSLTSHSSLTCSWPSGKDQDKDMDVEIVRVVCPAQSSLPHDASLFHRRCTTSRKASLPARSLLVPSRPLAPSPRHGKRSEGQTPAKAMPVIQILVRSVGTQPSAVTPHRSLPCPAYSFSLVLPSYSTYYVCPGRRPGNEMKK